MARSCSIPTATASSSGTRSRCAKRAAVEPMGSFAAIYAIAAARKGGPAALDALIAEHAPKTHDQIAATPDDRILAMMTERVFQAGFSWKVIENKWPGFEAAFNSFDPKLCAAMSEETFDALLK